MQTVMIIEEDKTVRKAFMEMLEDEGYSCTGAASFEAVQPDTQMSVVLFSSESLAEFGGLRSHRPHLKGVVIGPRTDSELPSDVSADLRGELRIGDLLGAVQELMPKRSPVPRLWGRLVKVLSFALPFRFA